MDNNNGRSDLLDRVCADLTPEQRAKVFDLTLRLDIHRDDPLFLIALAIGQLQILLQDSPQDLRLLFDTVEMELEEWAEAATTVLETTIKEAQNQEILAHATEQLLTILTALGKSLNELVSFLQMQSSKSGSSSLSQEFARLRQELDTRLQTNSTSLRDSITSQVSTAMLRHSSGTTSNTSDKRLLWVSLGANALLLLGGLFLWQSTVEINQRSKWLFIHQQRVECVVGVLPKNSRQCRTLLSQ